MAAPGKTKRRSRAFHRWAGIFLLVPILLATLTGVVLNHTVDLDLSKRHVTNSFVQSRYGMTLKGEPQAYGLSGKTYAAEWDENVFFRKNLIEDPSPLVGAVPLRDGVAIVTRTAVHYYGLDGALIENLDSASLPPGKITRAGRTPALTLALETPEGIRISDSELLDFTPAQETASITWSEKTTATPGDRQLWKSAYSGDGIPLDRLILDIHSGRFFGGIGKWIYDILCFGVLALSATGLILFLRNRKRSR